MGTAGGEQRRRGVRARRSPEPEEGPAPRDSCPTRELACTLERLLAENVRHLAAVEQVFSDGPQQIRRWTLLSAGSAAPGLLRCLALVSLGRWQMSRLAGRVLPLLASDTHRPVAGGIRLDPARAAGAPAS